MNIAAINDLNPIEARQAFRRCCGSLRWSREMDWSRPFESEVAVFEAADRIWWALEPADWLEAFASHPKIGAREGPRQENASTEALSRAEQSGARNATPEALEKLAEMNRQYEARFGYIFIVCATGKSADEMLAILESRLSNYPDEEIRCAAAEQAKITRIRLEKTL